MQEASVHSHEIETEIHFFITTLRALGTSSASKTVAMRGSRNLCQGEVGGGVQAELKEKNSDIVFRHQLFTEKANGLF